MVSQNVASCADQLFCSRLFDFSIPPGVDVNDLYFNIRIYCLRTQCECIDTDLNFCVRVSCNVSQLVALPRIILLSHRPLRYLASSMDPKKFSMFVSFW